VTDAVASLRSGRDDADAVAAVVLAEPGVARLSSGPAGAVGTYLPGRRVAGVRLSETEVEVHVVAKWVPSLPELGAQLRAALAPLAGSRAVAVYIDDLEVIPPHVGELPPAGAGAVNQLPPAAEPAVGELPSVGGT
jgi:hypothetical protein